MDAPLTTPRRRSAAVLASLLVGAALACWLVAARQMRGMDAGPGTDLGSFPFFLGVWVTMMAAMMLPSALPMVLLFDKFQRSQRRGWVEGATGVFVLSYLAVWAAFGVGAFLLFRGVRDLHPGVLAWSRGGPVVTGVVVAATGIYELTPLKRLCLRHCRGPLHFLLGGWKPGLRGAVAMGGEHALYCVGCCAGLMVLLFAVGVMSLTWMIVVAGIVFAQKVLPAGLRLRVPLAVVLVGLGIWIAVAADTVPGLTVPGASM